MPILPFILNSSDMSIELRPIRSEDKPSLKIILNTIDLFPAEMLDDMIHPFLHDPECQDIWFCASLKGKPIGLAYCAPEMLTEGTYNLYAIGVTKKGQGKGVGSQMMEYLENQLKAKGHRILIVETSGAPSFQATRDFYLKLGYTHEATLRDFWAEGDDKVIFWKKLTP